MGSMHTGLEDNAADMEKLTTFYEERARGGIGLIITGGYAPNRTGWLVPFSGKLTNSREVQTHQKMTGKIRDNGAAIFLQILHAGRYAYHPLAVAPSAIKSPISMFKPWQISERRILSTINDFAQCALLAKKAGYNGVEIMGSEGYLINQFLAPRTNQRRDKWGGTFENRSRFAVEIVTRTREKVGPDFTLMFRLSLLDLVEKGSTGEEMIELGKVLEKNGVDVFNSGIGWHEARVPTIATSVPRAAFAWATKRLKESVSIPVVAVNRINTPEVAEEIIAAGISDLVSLARPLLADAEEGRADEINTCIACNQGCLDQIFMRKRATCLVNPRACFETEFPFIAATRKKKIAVVGAGPAGLAFSITAAQRGHRISLFEAGAEIGGQFNFAKKIPGKEEFGETLRYYAKQLALLGVNPQYNMRVDARTLLEQSFDEIIIASGVRPRKIAVEGFNDSRVVSYADVLSGKVAIGLRVAIIGAGGIGFDVAEYLLHTSKPTDLAGFLAHWGISKSMQLPGALEEKKLETPKRKIYLMQRKAGKLGAGLGKTTGWIHRATLIDGGVEMLGEVEYQKLSPAGLHILQKQKQRILEVDHIVVCAGQESEKSLVAELSEINGLKAIVHVIGGAHIAAEVDAKRAILEGTSLALKI